MLHVIAGRGDGPWVVSTLEVWVDEQVKPINLLRGRVEVTGSQSVPQHSYATCRDADHARFRRGAAESDGSFPVIRFTVDSVVRAGPSDLLAHWQTGNHTFSTSPRILLKSICAPGPSYFVERTCLSRIQFRWYSRAPSIHGVTRIGGATATGTTPGENLTPRCRSRGLPIPTTSAPWAPGTRTPSWTSTWQMEPLFTSIVSRKEPDTPTPCTSKPIRPPSFTRRDFGGTGLAGLYTLRTALNINFRNPTTERIWRKALL